MVRNKIKARDLISFQRADTEQYTNTIDWIFSRDTTLNNKIVKKEIQRNRIQKSTKSSCDESHNGSASMTNTGKRVHL